MIKVIVINVRSKFLGLLKFLFVVKLLFIFLIVIGIKVKLIIVMIVLVIKGGNRCLIFEKNFVIRMIKMFEVIIEL